MPYAGVTWAFKDVITSAKLAQMHENLRVHDHISADQGGRLGALGAASTGTNKTDSTTGWVTTGLSVAVTIPAGVPTGRRVVFLANAVTGISVVGNVEQSIWRDAAIVAAFGRLPNPVVTTGFGHLAVGSEPVPAAGTYTYSLQLRNFAAGSWTFLNGALAVYLL